MKLTIKKGIIYNEDGAIIGALTDDATEEDERTIEMGSEALHVVEEFIENVKNGNYKPRSAVKKFEQIIEKYS